MGHALEHQLRLNLDMSSDSEASEEDSDNLPLEWETVSLYWGSEIIRLGRDESPKMLCMTSSCRDGRLWPEGLLPGGSEWFETPPSAEGSPFPENVET